MYTCYKSAPDSVVKFDAEITALVEVYSAGYYFEKEREGLGEEPRRERRSGGSKKRYIHHRGNLPPLNWVS